jgi:hypothetical protein
MSRRYHEAVSRNDSATKLNRRDKTNEWATQQRSCCVSDVASTRARPAPSPLSPLLFSSLLSRRGARDEFKA